MELCPKCKQMTGEIDHYTQELRCYSIHCDYVGPKGQYPIINCPVCGEKVESEVIRGKVVMYNKDGGYHSCDFGE